MNLGQTSFVYFLSKLVASILGFVATIYFARLLGAESLGIYYLVLTVVSWLGIVGNIGVTGAITKRVSEREEEAQYATAGIVLIGALFVIVSVGLVFLRSYVDSYVGYQATGYVTLLLLVTLANSAISALLNGLHLVHINGILSPVRIGGRSLLQIGAVMISLGLTGLFLGYAAGYVLVVSIGGIFVYRNIGRVKLPRKRHFRSLFDYAKFSWLGGLKSRMFSDTDILVLGFFVPTSLIGVYSVAWNIAMFLILFGGAISTTLFPEMSERASKEGPQAIAGLLEDALSYAGLMLIPGLVGSLIIGERLLRVYGNEFTQGTAVLSILIIAAIVRIYQKQLLNTLNAIDRPEIAFRVNSLFVVANLVLNIVLIYLYGWVGAAVATTLSVVVSLVAAYRALDEIIEFSIPYVEITRQWIAALFMGVVVFGTLWIENTYRLLGHNFATVVFLVALGAGVYFCILFIISAQFREIINRNAPFDLLQIYS